MDAVAEYKPYNQFSNSIPLNIKFYENENYNNKRRCKLILFGHCLGPNDIIDKNKKEDIIKYIERSCLNKAIEKSNIFNIRCNWFDEKFIDIYHSVCYKVAVNIDACSSIKSDYMINKIISGDIDLNKIAYMSSKELCPEKYEKIVEKVNERYTLERKIKYSELYQCRKCKRNQTTTERCYNRSWDEGVSITIKCLFCGNSWGG